MNDMSNTNKKKDLGMYEEESKAMYQEESKATEAKTTRGYRGKDNPRSSVTTEAYVSAPTAGPTCERSGKEAQTTAHTGNNKRFLSPTANSLP